MPTCVNCFFWNEPKKVFDNQLTVGECRRFPPPSTRSEIPHRWPVTRSSDWCGEYLPHPDRS